MSEATLFPVKPEGVSSQVAMKMNGKDSTEAIAAVNRLVAQLQQPEPKDDSDFNWDHDPSVIIPDQPGVAAYWNKADGLTVRQRAMWNEDADPIVHVSKQNVQAFIDALCDIAGIGRGP